MKAYRERDIVDWLIVLEERVAALEGQGSVLRPAATMQPDAASRGLADDTLLSRVWNGAPLVARLQFLRALMPAGHPYVPAIEEACALSEYHGRPEQLAAWVQQYPAPFADGVERLLQDLPVSQEPVELLAWRTLMEARRSFQSVCTALGLEWILPAIGASVTGEHEVVGEREAAVPPGTVASVHRRGIRQRGVLLLPAQVIRASSAPATSTERTVSPGASVPARTGDAPTPSTVQPAARDTGAVPKQSATGMPCTGSPEPTGYPTASPGWLSRFLHRSKNVSHPAIAELKATLPGTVDAVTRAVGEGAPGRTAPELERLFYRLYAPRAVGEGASGRTAPELEQLYVSRARGADEHSGQLMEMLLDLRSEVHHWLRTCGFEVIEPASGSPFKAGIMEAVEHRRTAHAQEHDRVARLERAGLKYGAELLFPAQVVVYRKEDVP